MHVAIYNNPICIEHMHILMLIMQDLGQDLDSNPCREVAPAGQDYIWIRIQVSMQTGPYRLS